MNCVKCGEPVPDNAESCPQCTGNGGTPPPNHLVWAILVTIFCCLPFGIPAIIFAAQVNSKWEAGDFAGAQQSSKRAKFWSWLGFAVGLFGSLIYIAIQALGLFAVAAANGAQ
ncbi:MAG: CD225/dispanin family protein [Lentisphaerae bacterium]|nr:CD225/dispanin family protein [Lentisphaerota bacterium]MCP4102251.1 CD225/dispanin family protein [Lentisphaerota bacterium]